MNKQTNEWMNEQRNERMKEKTNDTVCNILIISLETIQPIRFMYYIFSIGPSMNS